MEPSRATVKQLFARSRNLCAFPSCVSPLVEDSGTVTGLICHIKARSRGGPRYDAKQTEEERYSFENLILLCGRHSKLIDSEPGRYTVDMLREMKSRHEDRGTVELSPSDALKAQKLSEDYRALYINAGGHVMVDSPGSVQASNVVIKTEKKTIKMLPPEGSLASDRLRWNYIKHLIDKYNEFASKQEGRVFRHPAIYGRIKHLYGCDWKMVSLKQFADFASWLQKLIDGTMLGSKNRGQGKPNYSTFEEYHQKYETNRSKLRTTGKATGA